MWPPLQSKYKPASVPDRGRMPLLLFYILLELRAFAAAELARWSCNGQRARTGTGRWSLQKPPHLGACSPCARRGSMPHAHGGNFICRSKDLNLGCERNGSILG